MRKLVGCVLIVVVWGVLATALAGPPAASIAPRPRVEITQPVSGAPVTDRATVAFRVTGIDDSAIDRAFVSIDGVEIGTIEESPWIGTFAVEVAGEARTIEVRVQLSDGRMLDASRRTAPLVLQDEVDVRLVNLSVSVTDESGRPARGLAPADFRIKDGREVARIERWSEESQALAIMLVLDASGSMKGRQIETSLDAARAFIGKLEDRDRMGIVVFNHEITAALAPSADFSPALAALDTITARGGTALYDAICEGSSLLDLGGRGMRRVLVVLSDGRDAAQTGWKPASTHTLDEAIERAHRDDVILFTIGIGEHLRHEPAIVGDLSTEEILRTLADATGGRSITIASADRLDAVFTDVLEEARHQYSIAFKPAEPKPGETWRDLDVDVLRQGLSARTRRGYYVR